MSRKPLRDREKACTQEQVARQGIRQRHARDDDETIMMMMMMMMTMMIMIVGRGLEMVMVMTMDG